MLVGLFDFELSAEHRGASARIHNITRPDRLRRAIGSDRQLNAVLRELDATDRSLFVHFRAGFTRMIKQHLVEILACDLVRVIGLRTVAVLEVKLRSRGRARAHDFAAVLLYEPGAQK